MITTTSRARQVLRRVRRAWAECHHANRRLFEIQTGLSSVQYDDRSGAVTDQLERLFRAT